MTDRTELGADVVVVGAGIMGTSIAFQLVKRGAGRVVLIDPRGLAGGMSGSTFGQVRHHYSNELMVRLANRGFEVIRSWADEVGVGDPAYSPFGYLLCVPEQQVEACRRNVAMTQGCGVDTSFVSPDEIARIEPLLRLDGVAGAAYEPDGGYVDTTKMILSWFVAATARGLVSMLGTAATGIEAEGGQVVGVRTDRGLVRSRVVVNAAGPWGRDLVEPLGLDLPISFSRVQMAMLRQRPDRALLRTSVTDAAANLVMRPDRGSFALAVAYGGAFAPTRDLDVDPPTDPGYEEQVRTALRRSVPEYLEAEWVWGVSGVYDATPDWHPILGWAPGIEGLYLALGWSGHGLKLSPAVGEIVADEVVGASPFLDVSALRLERFAEGRPMHLAYGPGARA